MFPDLFSIGPFTLHTYGLFVAIGFFLGLTVTVKIAKTEGLNSQQVLDMGFIVILSAIAGSRVMYIIMNITYYYQHPLDILKIWQGGLVFSGGIIGVIFALVWYVRRHNLSLLKICDLWAPAAALGQGIGRIGCFMAGCCYGRYTDVGWAVIFTQPHALAPQGVSLHPTQLYSSISGLVIFLIIFLLYSRRQFNGQVFLWFLILHSTARLGVEHFRGDDRGIFLNSDMSATQCLATLILVASVVALIVLKSRNDKRKKELPLKTL